MLDDWRSAPVSPRLSAALGLLEKLTLTPDDVQPTDVAALRTAGVSDQAITDVIYVCFLFNVIDRVADALDFDIPASFGKDVHAVHAIHAPTDEEAGVH
ncbi:MAG: hypothetical protein ABI068_16960 [Ktedonobacterales bacterium]